MVLIFSYQQFPVPLFTIGPENQTSFRTFVCSIWFTLHQFHSFLINLAHFGFWLILNQFGSFQSRKSLAVVAGMKKRMTTQNRQKSNAKFLKIILDHFGLIWISLAHIVHSWLSFKYIGSFRTNLACFGSVCSICVSLIIMVRCQ